MIILAGELRHIKLVNTCCPFLLISLIIIIFAVGIKVFLCLTVLFLDSISLSCHSFLRLIISFLPTQLLLDHSELIFHLVMVLIILSNCCSINFDSRSDWGRSLNGRLLIGWQLLLSLLAGMPQVLDNFELLHYTGLWCFTLKRLFLLRRGIALINLYVNLGFFLILSRWGRFLCLLLNLV